MAEDLANKGPGISLQQRIGDDARSALYANKPQQWILGESPGDDFGYDFQVTVFGSGNAGAQCSFNIQLKGTTQSKALSADESSLSYSFDRTTLNLWHNSGFAVLVVIADLIKSRDPKEAKVYFHFANYDLDEILPTLPEDQKTVTLHVPTSQLVHRDLDILPIVRAYLDEIKYLRRQMRERKRAAGVSSSEAVSIISVQSNASVRSEIISPGNEIEALIDTLARRVELKAALTALRSGDYDKVLRLTPAPSFDEAEKVPKEAAICAYLRALALEDVGDSAAADTMIDVAASLLPDNDDIATLAAQKQLNAIGFGPEGHKSRQALLVSLQDHKGPGIINLKAKVYALEGDFQIARELLESSPPEKIPLTMVIISIIEQAWERALSEIESSRLLPFINDKQLLWLDTLEAKAHLELALANVERPKEGDFIIPSTGLPGIDYDRLRLSFDASLKAMLDGQRLNWPATIQYTLDAFPISSMLLGYEAEALPLLSALALARPTVTKIREVVAKFAVQYDHPQISIQLGELAEDSPLFEHETAVMAVAAYKAGNTAKALSYVTDDFLENPSMDNIYLSSLLQMGIATASTLRVDLLDKIKGRLDRDEESRHYRAILESAVQVNNSLLRRPEAIQELHAYWDSHGKPVIVGYHLLDNSDPTNAEEAVLIVSVATNLETGNSLGAEHLAILGQALLTLNKIPEAISCLKDACKRFTDEPRLTSLLGIAFEFNGQSAVAFQLIGQLLESGEATESARRYFINIATRMGFFDRAEEQVRAALANATDPDRRKWHLNTLFQLLLAAGDRQKNVEEVAWEYGRLTNQEDEREEGIFLQEYLVATLPDNIEIQPERIQEFHRRLDAYNERFPESRFLWKASIPTGSPPEAMLEALSKASGVTDQEIAEGLAIEQQMDRGALQVPFSWRPRRFLRNVSDIFMLWEIRKQVPLERAAFHFSNNFSNYGRHTPSDLKATEIVLSLTSLLLLDEIKLLTTVLEVFERLVIARSTLISLQEARNAFTSGWGYEKATRIMKELQEQFRKIIHPPYPTDDHQGTPEWHQEEKTAMQQTGRIYFCDDIVETVLVCGSGDKEATKPSMSTVNFLEWADQSKRVLTAQQVASNLGHLIRLKVGFITIKQRYLIAAIPHALQSAATLAEEKEALTNEETLHSILDGIWDSSKPFNELLNHFAQTMRYLLNEGHASEAILVFFWLRWIQSVRFKVEPRQNVWWKIAIGFQNILILLDPDKTTISRLWQSFWATIKRGLTEELNEPEDVAGVRAVAKILGVERANASSTLKDANLFEMARLGLEQGTELDNIFNEVYVTNTAEETKRLLAEE